MGYKVKLDVFEGPFDLLVYLIESAEMSIYDIRISEITNQYMDYIDCMQRADMALAGEFLVLAASLIEIKSKMLLPRIKQEDATDPVEDPRNELVQKLLEYKRYKGVADKLEQQEERAMQIHTKPQEDLSPYMGVADVYLNVDVDLFIRAFRLFLNRKKRLEEVKKHYSRIERQRMSVETRIEQMKQMFCSKKKLRFRELLAGENSRYNVVLTFVSILELIRQGSVKVKQNINFGEIVLTANDTVIRSEKGA